MERRGGRFPRYRARGVYNNREPGPRFSTVENIVPDTGVVNLRCETVTEARLVKEEGGRLWEVVVGDQTGVVLLHLDDRSSNIALALKPHISLTLKFCQVKMLQHRFLVITPEARGVVDVSPMKLHIPVNTAVNVSAYEYKYVED